MVLKKNVVPLSLLKIGQTAKIVEVHCKNKRLEERLLEMGVTQNEIVLIKKYSPFGDPVCFEVRGYELCLRVCDARDIFVLVIE